MNKLLVACAVAFALAFGAAPASAETDLGVLAGIVTGVHTGAENPNPLTGYAPGAVLEATQRWGRFRIHLEGIPQVGVNSSATGTYGHSMASISLVNATAAYALDHNQRFRAGVGFQLVNLTNANGDNGDRNQARITSPRYEGVADLPVARARFVELSFADMPNLSGILHIFNNAQIAFPAKPEKGAEVDYAAAYGWRGPGATYLVGVRGISYHTRNLDNGELVDRNVGGGVTFEVRFPVAR